MFQSYRPPQRGQVRCLVSHSPGLVLWPTLRSDARRDLRPGRLLPTIHRNQCPGWREGRTILVGLGQEGGEVLGFGHHLAEDDDRDEGFLGYGNLLWQWQARRTRGQLRQDLQGVGHHWGHAEDEGGQTKVRGQAGRPGMEGRRFQVAHHRRRLHVQEDDYGWHYHPTIAESSTERRG